MPKQSIALKIDFKIAAGKLRIIDLGDGLGAGIAGFEDIPVSARLLHDLHEANPAALITLFGELPFDAMQPETLHIPLIPRQISSADDCLNIKNLPYELPLLRPYSEFGRLQSFISYAWSKEKANIAVTPNALIALEMHKLFWYVLMQKHVHAEDLDNFLYWTNHSSVDIDLSKIDMENGAFIKIADRSDGGASEVYYAKDSLEVKTILCRLKETYANSPAPYKKHIFVIEPAYMTLKTDEQGRSYNVTGRAFITLTFDSSSQSLDLKIAAAKWMYPCQFLEAKKTTKQMLSNVKNSSGMLTLNEEELEFLRKEIIGCYGEVFKVGFQHENLMDYCKENPITQEFISCLRPNAAYKMQLETFVPESSDHDKKVASKCMIHSLIIRDFLQKNELESLLQSARSEVNFFLPKGKMNREILLIKICRLSFYEGYFKFAKNCEFFSQMYPQARKFFATEALVKQTIDEFILKFLAQKNPKYDLKNLDRTLRQAASVCDIEVLKLLIHTHRANVNALSPETKQTALDLAMKSKQSEDQKAIAISILEVVDAKLGEELQHQSLVL